MSKQQLPFVLCPRPQEGLVSCLVVGAGGVGARILPLLVKLLPRGSDVTVVDPDFVEPRNTWRQPFVAADVGKPKALIMQERYDTEAVRVRGVVRRVSLSDDWTGRSVIISAVDNVNTRRQMREWHDTNQSLIWIDCGTDGNFGQVCLSGRIRPSAGESVRVQGWRYWPQLFTGPIVRGDVIVPTPCDAVDTQTAIGNQIAATWAMQYLNIWLHGLPLGHCGVEFSTYGAQTLINMERVAQGYAIYAFPIRPSVPEPPSDGAAEAPF